MLATLRSIIYRWILKHAQFIAVAHMEYINSKSNQRKNKNKNDVCGTIVTIFSTSEFVSTRTARKISFYRWMNAIGQFCYWENSRAWHIPIEMIHIFIDARRTPHYAAMPCTYGVHGYCDSVLYMCIFISLGDTPSACILAYGARARLCSNALMPACVCEAAEWFHSPSAVGKFCLHTQYCAIFNEVVRCASRWVWDQNKFHFIMRETRARYTNNAEQPILMRVYCIEILYFFLFSPSFDKLRFSRRLLYIRLLVALKY